MKIEELNAAIAAGNSAAALALVGAEPELLRGAGAGGASPVLQALYQRQPGVAESLASAKQALDVFEAAALGRVERIRELCDERPELATAVAADGFTALHLAAFFGTPEAVVALLGAGAEPSVAAANPSGVHPLHSAAASGADESVRLLLEAGADPNATQTGGYTALHAAALHHRPVMVRALLAHGARRELETDDGRTAEELARSAEGERRAETLTALSG